MLTTPATKYPASPVLALPDRTWPNQQITRAPIWMSTDLRDGNQALFEPMNGATKLRMFQLLVEIGFKEIEVAFPAASRTDFDFVRTLIEGGHIPDDVTIEVITQAREDLIRETFEALRGAPKAIVHLYNATAPAWRRTVFGMSRDEVKHLAVRSTTLIRQLAQAQTDTRWTFQYSPETFSTTEPEFALDVCNAVIEAWQPTVAQPMIINLPATVEASTPNVYADQIEWMHRRLAQRGAVILSVHPHNDRGTAVAAAELAVMAGAQRVEGCLFGNGERTGNVDLVTLALNLYSQGVSPELDFSNLPAIARTVEHCIALPVHPRHPYAGDLVFTAFSGSHQDAIRKGLAAQQADAPWTVPYLPIDPRDVGASYEAVIRVNSQSGKGGITYLLESAYGLVIPRRAQVEFSASVQAVADDTGRELTAGALWALFQAEYLAAPGPWALLHHHVSDDLGQSRVELLVQTPHGTRRLQGHGNGPLDAAWQAVQELGLPDGAQWHGFEEHATREGSDATALAWVEVGAPGVAASVYGAGRHPHMVSASVQAMMQALNRLAIKAGWSAQAEMDPDKERAA
ncbi:MAG: 2-isopropylmalate synthase [Aquabacterium sp.]|uniref:2-isopropylmalate synthase n=1 Tax=Aquabacterium sp. TaxID=1872578 RepID=UPI0025BDA643|nr:2-isopropylmalate synthase [Aquabacterium sp.]MBI3383323.1 2-isopropylmalate synthase [Aquabacterium sp.]